MTRSSRPATLSVYRATAPEDLLNALPTMFGFVPHESVIAICASGARGRLGFRMRTDIPERRHFDVVAASVAGHVDRYCGQGVHDGIILVALSQDPEAAEELLWTTRRRLTSPTLAMIWATEDQYWTGDESCPAGGVPWTRDRAHESIVRAVAEGHRILESREELVAEFDPLTGPRRDWLDHGFAAAVERLARTPDPDPRPLVHRALDGHRLDDGQLLELAAMIMIGRLRDLCWLEMEPGEALGAAELWTQVARVAPLTAAAWPLGLAAFGWWLSGDGARAVTAAERGLDLVPGHSLCSIALRLLQGGVDPGNWPTMRAAVQ